MTNDKTMISIASNVAIVKPSIVLPLSWVELLIYPLSAAILVPSNKDSPSRELPSC